MERQWVLFSTNTRTLVLNSLKISLELWKLFMFIEKKFKAFLNSFLDRHVRKESHILNFMPLEKSSK
jgi:hypothetical protein